MVFGPYRISGIESLKPSRATRRRPDSNRSIPSVIVAVDKRSMGLDDFVGTLLVSDGLGYVVVIAFQRHRRNHDRGFEPFELAGATSKSAACFPNEFLRAFVKAEFLTADTGFGSGFLPQRQAGFSRARPQPPVR